MKKIITLSITLLLCCSLLASAVLAAASDAKQDWLDAKDHSKEMQEIHRDAKLAFADDKSEENRQAVVDTGKDTLNAALDEAEAWLTWKQLEAEENTNVPLDIVSDIQDDVSKNLDKIDGLREEVDAVENPLGLGVTFLKMVGQYFEIVADTARNSGNMWVHIGEEKADTLEEYAGKIRDATDDPYALELLGDADSELSIARNNLENAKGAYAMVKVPGQPLIKFAEGNNYLNAARLNLLNAWGKVNQAYMEALK